MSILKNLKAKYNEVLERHNKGAAYLDSDVSLEQKEKWAPEFSDIVRSMNELAGVMAKEGHTMTDDEILKGFEEGNY